MPDSRPVPPWLFMQQPASSMLRDIFIKTESMTDDFEYLCSDEARKAIEQNIDRDPVAVALDRRIAHAATVATQVKYLQRARRKLPSYYAARCIVPPLAFEQSSSEECAAHKCPEGASVLDLTCGLGVDAFALSKRFARVVTVERNEALAAVAEENFRRLGAENICVVCDSAEHFVETTDEKFDWCIADPDRRGADGSKKVLAEDCSPNIFYIIPKLMPKHKPETAPETDSESISDTTPTSTSTSTSTLTPPTSEVAKAILLKMSPMFDVGEAFRVFGQFGPCSVETVSVGDECKEVLVVLDPGRRPTLTATAVGKGSFSVPVEELGTEVPVSGDMKSARFLIVPDVALQKSRLVRRYFAASGFVYSENGFVFSAERPAEGVLGRVFEIEEMSRYDPRRLRRELKGRRVEMLLRDVPLTAARIMQATGLREGGEVRMAFTSVEGEIWAIRLK